MPASPDTQEHSVRGRLLPARVLLPQILQVRCVRQVGLGMLSC